MRGPMWGEDALCYAVTQGQLAGLQTGKTECDRGSGELGPGESRHNNADGRLKPRFNHSLHPPANRKLHIENKWQHLYCF